MKTRYLLFLLALAAPAFAFSQSLDPQNPSGDEMVLVSAHDLADLLRHRENDEMINEETIVNLEEALRAIEDRKLEKAGVSIFPDVTPDYLQVELPYELDYSILLKNSDEREILSLDQVYGSNQLNLHDLPNGNYRLYVIAEGQTYTKSIRKE